MTTSLRIAGGRLEALDADTEAYFDADWLPREDGEVAAFLAASGQIRTTWDDRAFPLGEASSRDFAGLALAATAAEALAIAREAGGEIDVVGGGVTAGLIRGHLGDHASALVRPDAIIDCTGNPDAIHAALERVDDLGMLILAGPPAGRPLAVDLYTDVHVRGLTIIGIAPPLASGAPAFDALPELLATTLGETTDGRLIREAAWYRLAARKLEEAP